ncbi:hypothetical protein AC578_6885 [Pseudocercospora eumusae]|uniref:Extracellular mutant protein 11 C-terminal domain-containing protein n=1 Tax=Pseudocercospora eumusae TaxID=321146 RepID=A0A139H9V3_9PEZI|nr:hypothetical protein AC578_6885 [Pseudocercospora eumusae]
MVKDDDQGLHRYVMRQHTAGGHDGQNDNDLSAFKVPVPGAGGGGGGGRKRSTSANTHQTRSNTRPQRKKSAGQKDVVPHAQQNLYGTDASVADQVSTTESAMPNQQPKSEQQLMDSQPETRNVRGANAYEDDPDEDNDQEYVNQQPDSHPQAASRSGDPRHQVIPHSVIGKRLSGDSYPETTSGTPSVVDQHATQDRRAPTTQNAPPAMRSRGPGGRAIPSGGEHVQVQALTTQLPQNGGLGPLNLYSQPGPKNTNALMGVANPSFSFIPTQQPQLNMARPGPAQARPLQPTQQPQRQHQQEKVVLPQEQQQQVRPATWNGYRSVSTDQAQHGSEVPPKAHTPAEHEPQQHPVGGGRGETRSPFEHAQPQLLPKQRANRTEDPLEQRPVLPSEAEQEYSDGADPSFNGYPSANGDDEQYPPVDENLDYEVKELVKMDYSRLKAMPVDADPYILPFEFDAAEQPATLDEKFKAAASLPPDTQAEFFATLNLEEWEQAGDWFLVRFGDLANRFKNARNAKRRAAREFESEIERRHEMVAKKQKCIEIAMNDMKESGGKVLQATPKKTRKVK